MATSSPRPPSDMVPDLLKCYRRLSVADRKRFDEALVREPSALSHQLQTRLDIFHRGRRVQQERVRRRNEFLAQMITRRRMPAKTLADWEAIRQALIAADCFLAIDCKLPEEEKSPAWWEQHYLSARPLRDSYLRNQKIPRKPPTSTQRAS